MLRTQVQGIASTPSSLEVPATGLQSRAARPSGWREGLAHGDERYQDEMTSRVEAELSWNLALSTPLAVLGATLLAHGSTLPNQTLTLAGALSIAVIFVLQIRARLRVRSWLISDAVSRGASTEQARQDARRFLKEWFR